MLRVSNGEKPRLLDREKRIKDFQTAVRCEENGNESVSEQSMLLFKERKGDQQICAGNLGGGHNSGVVR